MEFVSPIISPIVQSLMVPIKRHLDFLVSPTMYVKKVNRKMNDLKACEQRIQKEKQRAVENTEIVPENVEPWLEGYKDLVDRSIAIQAIGCNVAKRYKVGKTSYGMLKEIQDLVNQESKIVFTHRQTSLAKVGDNSLRSSTSTPVLVDTQNNFESRDLIFNEALQFLQSNKESQKMIALCGMGGVGKTTMMEQLKKTVEDSKMFDWVVPVVIGENKGTYSLQDDIAQYMTIAGKLTETTKEARAERLNRLFEAKSQKGSKKILVIMDDLWKEFELKDAGLSPLPNGVKLLFTSRLEHVCIQMGVKAESIFRVGVLKDSEAQALFSRNVEVSPMDRDDADLERTGEDIVKICGGLPIAIVTIAKHLKRKPKDEWKLALSNLRHHDLRDLYEIVDTIFRMSYDNLEREDKEIFLLAGLFPGDFNIPIEDLMIYGWGLKLFTEVDTLTEARMWANTCVNNLIRANLLTTSDRTGCVKMHHLMRTFALSNFSQVKQASIVNHDNMPRERLTKDSYERLLLKCTGMSKFFPDFNYQNLSLLMLMDGYELLKFPEDMFKQMKRLEVLSYENMAIPVLPTNYEYSSTLRTLCLRSCSLTDEISFIGSLCQLETLSLANCNIRKLPETIGNLKKLKLLDLTGCVDLRIDQGVFQNLDSLKELYMRASKGRPIQYTPANCDELEKLSQVLLALDLEFFDNKLQPKNVSFKNLDRFRISIGCELKNYETYSFRNTINLVAACNVLNECNIRDVFEKTEELRLEVKYMIHFENVSLHHTFSQLRFLYISKCAELAYLFTVDVANGLKKLERLTVSECPIMKELIVDNIGTGLVTLNKLSFMSMEDLPMMVSLCNNVIRLPELVEMRLDRLPMFTSIYPDSNNNTSEAQPLFNERDVIPKLERLDISKMQSLKQIWASTIKNDDVSTFRQIRVRECDRLINLFPTNPLPLLNHLEEVVVKRCDSIEVLFNIDFESVCGMGTHNSSRLRRIEVFELGKLKELWRMRGISNSDILINSFKGVESIKIEGCRRFTNTFTPTETNFDLGALTSFKLTYHTFDLEAKDRKINATYPSNLLSACHRLRDLHLEKDERVGVMFDMDSPSSRQLETTQPRPLLLPFLESIHLHRLNKMSHVWKCNWNEFRFTQHQPFLPFQNLTYITLVSCDKIKYLFSPIMAQFLSSLKYARLNWCNGIEEVISSRDDENTASTSSYQNTTLFPHFDTLELNSLECLVRINSEENTWSGTEKTSSNTTKTIHDHLQSGRQVIGAYWSLCQYPRKIVIHNCNALSSLIPWYAVGHMKKLQELKIKSCDKMTEVFENKSMNNNTNYNVYTSLTSQTSTSRITSVFPQLTNLKTVCIYDCNLLSHIFTFSILESLSELKELKVKRCNTMQVIVKEENETSVKKAVVFPCLETLELDDLANLKGFFLGMNEFQWPSLVNVMINDCPKWEVFTSAEFINPKPKYVHTSFGKYSLEDSFNFQTTFPTSSDSAISKGISFPFNDFIEIKIVQRDNIGTTVIPSHALQQVQKLENVTIKACRVNAVFEVLENKSSVEESRAVVKIPNLREVNLSRVLNLKYLWKSNQWMVLEFPNLTTLDIQDCFMLEHVFTCSMVGSLVQLRDLCVTKCWKIDVIVREEEEECDAKVNEIMLPRLRSLKLIYLSSLKGFCFGKNANFSFPSLETLQISNCPTITAFTKGQLSTPKLIEIETSFGMSDVRTDINSFIETKLKEGHEF